MVCAWAWRVVDTRAYTATRIRHLPGDQRQAGQAVSPGPPRPGPPPADVGRPPRLSPWPPPTHDPAVADMLAKPRREFLKARYSAIRPAPAPPDQTDDYAWTCDTPAA